MLKRLLILCLIALGLGIGTNVCFVLYLNPDFNFFEKLAKTSVAWEQKLRPHHPHVYVLAGGSSGRAGIDPQILLDEYQIPLVNAAMGAGYGLDANVALTRKHLRANDTLILNIEPGLLIGKKAVTTELMGVRMLFHQDPRGFYQTPLINWTSETYLAPFLGNSRELASYITKRLTRPKDELFAYDTESRILPSGRMDVITTVSWHPTAYTSETAPSLSKYDLAAAATQSYKRIQEMAKAQNVQVIAMIPRQYAHESFRAHTLWLALQLTRLGLPVIHDPLVGVITSTALLADTAQHLNTQGAVEHSRQLGESLQKQRFWSEQELIDELRKRGFDAQGMKANPAPLK